MGVDLIEWKPILEAPTDSDFYALDSRGDLIQVRRYAAYCRQDDYSGGYVINGRTGRFWRVNYYIPKLPDTPEAP